MRVEGRAEAEVVGVLAEALVDDARVLPVDGEGVALDVRHGHALDQPVRVEVVGVGPDRVVRHRAKVDATAPVVGDGRTIGGVGIRRALAPAAHPGQVARAGLGGFGGVVESVGADEHAPARGEVVERGQRQGGAAARRIPRRQRRGEVGLPELRPVDPQVADRDVHRRVAAGVVVAEHGGADAARREVQQRRLEAPALERDAVLQHQPAGEEAPPGEGDDAAARQARRVDGRLDRHGLVARAADVEAAGVLRARRGVRQHHRGAVGQRGDGRGQRLERGRPRALDVDHLADVGGGEVGGRRRERRAGVGRHAVDEELVGDGPVVRGEEVAQGGDAATTAEGQDHARLPIPDTRRG